MTGIIEFLRARLAEDEGLATYGGPTTSWAPRLLAEVEAKRRIIDHAELWAATLHETPEGWTETGATAYRMAMAWTLNQLASTYAGHADYVQF
jgi:hypothetical protein